jgi:hypothetical protein
MPIFFYRTRLLELTQNPSPRGIILQMITPEMLIKEGRYAPLGASAAKEDQPVNSTHPPLLPICPLSAQQESPVLALGPP